MFQACRCGDTREEHTKFAQCRYVRTGSRPLLRNLTAYWRVVSLMRVGTTNRAGYVGENCSGRTTIQMAQ